MTVKSAEIIHRMIIAVSDLKLEHVRDEINQEIKELMRLVQPDYVIRNRKWRGRNNTILILQ